MADADLEKLQRVLGSAFGKTKLADLLRVIENAKEFAHPYVRTLRADDDRGRPHIIGSAVLFWYRGRRFLATAAHCLSGTRDRPFHIGTNSVWLPVPRQNYITTFNEENPTSDDGIDLAVIGISERFAAELDGCDFLVGRQQETTTENSSNRGYFIAMGFPQNKLHYDHAQNRTNPWLYGISLQEAVASRYESYKIDRRKHHLCDFDKKNGVSRKGVGEAASVHGMSGGGLFRSFALESNLTNVAPPVVCGILTEHRKSQKAMVALRFHVVLAAVQLGLDTNTFTFD